MRRLPDGFPDLGSEEDGWRPALLYFNADVAPSLAIFMGGVALAGIR